MIGARGRASSAPGQMRSTTVQAACTTAAATSAHSSWRPVSVAAGAGSAYSDPNSAARSAQRAQPSTWRSSSAAASVGNRPWTKRANVSSSGQGMAARIPTEGDARRSVKSLQIPHVQVSSARFVPER